MNRFIAAIALTCCILTAHADVEVSNAWARATAPGQEVGAAYLSLKSTETSTLVAIQSPIAGAVEIHSMTVANGVMKMRMLKSLALPAGKMVKFGPYSLHLMLINLKQALKAGNSIELTLTLQDRNGKQATQKVMLPVKALN
jgi:periplasmic copper chaperone A